MKVHITEAINDLDKETVDIILIEILDCADCFEEEEKD